MKQLLLSMTLLAGLGFVTSCDDDGPQVIVGPSPTDTIRTVIEYRAVGNASSARIRYSNPIDGLSQVVTTLPFYTTFSTIQESVFVSLEATPIAFPFSVVNPFNSVQIFADGRLFREASSADFLSSAISVSGTYRR